MPAALNVDWGEVRMLAISVGVREAARQVGISEESVMQRSSREGWLRDLPRSQPLPRTVLQPVSVVSTPAQALAASMRDKAIRGRAAALTAGCKALERMAEQDADELLLPEVADVALKWTKQHATAAGYGAGDAVAKVALSITGGHAVTQDQSVTLEAQWCDAERDTPEASQDVNDY